MANTSFQIENKTNVLKKKGWKTQKNDSINHYEILVVTWHQERT